MNLSSSLSFKQTKSLPPEARQALLEWGDDIFHSKDLNLIWRPKDTHIILYRDGEPVSKCGLLKQTIYIGDKAVEVGGIGGVVTAPGFQGEGYATRVMREATRVLKEDWKLPAGVLFCLDALVPFYAQQKWRTFAEPVTIHQPDGEIPCPVRVMYRVLNIAGVPDHPVDINGLPW